MQLRRLVQSILGPERTEQMFSLLVIHPDLSGASEVSRAVMAQALNMVLFSDLLDRVPAAAEYAADCQRDGQKVLHDHGAVRTVVLNGMGALPSGEEALLRVLRPLGYRPSGLYPLERLKMTGRSYAQADFPEDIAQFFVSELHVDRFSAGFAAAALSVTRSSGDPLSPQAKATLARFESEGRVDFAAAAAALPVLAACFDRQHEIPELADYETLLAESAEMAWIATEGNAFNHATDRVADVEALAQRQKALGRPMKEAVEVSGSGRVRQTAFRAAQVTRDFRSGDRVVSRVVPGSFYEFITRLPMVDESTGRTRLDLAFDSSNAQGIFKMTEAAAAAG
ncbi:2-oxoadipate dioxygenase/decarboxylase family protein [Phenylobacterium sp. VNQ135]|uniref:2-oxoadipate dioxygenase/decarboxylase family protein n=1 Tax=Phenylobacterium sp. VNQ135 TaxID=3400922 RepID=UPI003C0C98C1